MSLASAVWQLGSVTPGLITNILASVAIDHSPVCASCGEAVEPDCNMCNSCWRIRMNVLEKVGMYERWREGGLGQKPSLSGANLRRADLSGADLRGADLRGAALRGANLSGADLSRANLSRAILTLANLHGANLSRANLSRAILIEANLIEANLIEANLRGAILSEADLHGANLSEADLHGTIFNFCKVENCNGIKILLIDPRSEGYILIKWKVKGGGMYNSGCRCYTEKNALTHWGQDYPDPKRGELYVNAIETEAGAALFNPRDY